MDSELIQEVQQYLASERQKAKIRPFLLLVVAGMFLLPIIAWEVTQCHNK